MAGIELDRWRLHTIDMRRPLLIAAALAALLSACSTEPATDGGDGSITAPRGERCDDMQMCGRMQCDAELAAVAACAIDETIGGCVDSGEIVERRQDLVDCLEYFDCVTVDTCDVGAWADAAEAICDDPDEEEALGLALRAMFADSGDEAVVECMSLE